jgi:hypothetical protein
MVSIGSYRWEGKILQVPYEFAGEVVRILTDAYGSNAVISNKINLEL